MFTFEEFMGALVKEGIDTPEKLGPFLAMAAAMVERGRIDAAIERQRADQAAAVAASQAAIGELLAQRAEIEARLKAMGI